VDEMRVPNLKRRPRPRSKPRSNGRGLGVDALGGPTVDPTENVKDLSQALSERQDDIREINNLYLLTRMKGIEEMASLRAKHAKEINALESNRLDKIRQVDILNASRSEERAGEAIKTLVAQTATNAETLRTMVTNSAATLAAQLTNLFAESNKRLSALELSSSEGRGKQAVADPMMLELLAEVKGLQRARAGDTERRTHDDPMLDRMMEKLSHLEADRDRGAGKTAGISATTAAIAMGIMMIVGLITIGTFIFITMRQPVPQVMYTPAPAGSLLPTPSVPR
jgi:hypothetical protein